MRGGADTAVSRPTSQLANQSVTDTAHLLGGAWDELLGVAQEALVLVLEDGDGEDEEGVHLLTEEGAWEGAFVRE